MSDLRTAAIAIPAPQAPARFNRSKMFRALGASLILNALFPYLIYRALEPRFPIGSVMPLLASTVFPLLGLAVSLFRKRSADIVAIISLAEIAMSIAVIFMAQDIRLALLARAAQGTLTGLFFLATILIGRPIFYYAALQFVRAGSPEVASDFEAGNRRDEGRTFRNVTAVWGFGLILVSFVNLALAARMAPADYVLFSPIIGTGTNVILIAWTIRYATRRLQRVGAEAMRQRS